MQLDELQLKLHGAAEAAWLWIACDAITKIISASTLGPRTQAMAQELGHDVARRQALGCLPVFSSPTDSTALSPTDTGPSHWVDL